MRRSREPDIRDSSAGTTRTRSILSPRATRSAASEPSIPAVLRARAAEHPDRPLAAQRDARRSLDHAHLRRGARQGRRARAGASRPRARPRPAGDGPVGQLARAPAGQPRRLRRRRAGDADQRRLLADERRPRSDQVDRGADATRASCSPTTPARSARALDALAPTCRRRSSLAGERAGALRLDDLLATAPGSRSRTRRGGRTRTPSPSCCSPRARPASPRASSTPTGCCAPTRRCSRPSGRSWPTSRRSWSTGCRGATPSAPTTTSTSCCSTAARCTSTTASPAPPLFPRTLAALERRRRRRVYFNVPAGFALLAPRARERRRSSPSTSSAGCASCSTPAPRCPTRSRCGCARSPRELADHEVPLTSSWGTTETAPARDQRALPRRARSAASASRSRA